MSQSNENYEHDAAAGLLPRRVTHQGGVPALKQLKKKLLPEYATKLDAIISRAQAALPAANRKILVEQLVAAGWCVWDGLDRKQLP